MQCYVCNQELFVVLHVKLFYTFALCEVLSKNYMHLVKHLHGLIILKFLTRFVQKH